MRGNETPYTIWIEIYRVVGIPGLITYANLRDLRDDRLKGLGMAGGLNFALPHRLSSSFL